MNQEKIKKVSKMIKSKMMLAMLLLTAVAQSACALTWRGGGTADNPYLIGSVDEWNQLAIDVGGGTTYEGIYFRLNNDIEFTDAGNSSSNCKTIGATKKSGNKPFHGTFDGDGNAIIGFNIRNGDDALTDLGLFGHIGSNGTVKNLVIKQAYISINSYAGAVAALNNGTIDGIIVTNCTIEVYNNVAGGVAGSNDNHGNIQNCHVLDNVTIRCTSLYKSEKIGGIAGSNDNYSIINNCSNATTIAYDGTTNSNITKYGGIVGSNTNSSTVENCIYLGSDVVAGANYGSIAGLFYGTLQNNYYTLANTGGVTNEDKPDNDGAVPALRNDKDNTKALELLAARKTYLTSKGFSGNCAIRLYGRTLYKDGYWNTLCLPFDVTLSGNVWDGVTVKTLESSSFGSGTLTLNFEDATIIEAGKPYIIKWTKPDPYTAYNGNNASTCSDIVNPSFTNVNIKNVDAPKITDEVIFQGNFSPMTLTANDNTVLYLGANSTLYYPSADVTLGSCRAYFQLKGLTAGEPTTPSNPNQSINTYSLNFGDEESTGIVDAKANPSLSEWYSLSGRRYATPTALPKGVYIHNGRKVVIK